MHLSALLLVTYLCSFTLLRAESPGKATLRNGVFNPPGMWTWDNWFVKQGDTWHAFYLQLPHSVGVERRWKNNDPYKHVGHATSTDLLNWQDQGPALTALSDTWNDRHIATGSIIQHNNQWWMFFTGRGYKGDAIGLALSSDLKRWITQPDPLFPLTDTFGDGKNIQAFQAEWQGKTYSWVGISDPYILPELHDGYYYMILCSRIVGEPIATSGCLTMVRSKDLKTWENAGILAWPGCFERMETPQLWQADGKWHLYFGGVINAVIDTSIASAEMPSSILGKKSHQNYVYSSDEFGSPRNNEQLHYISTPPGHFIMKVLPVGDSKDVAIFSVKEGEDSLISRPYDVTYSVDGGIALDLSPR